MSLPLAWTAVVPVKHTRLAKSRLSGRGESLRRRLAMAFVTDTVDALSRCRVVAGTLLVTNDADVADAFSALDIHVALDEPDAGLNPALAHGAGVAAAQAPTNGILLMSADLPALRPHELQRALADAERHPRAFVCDIAGLGTTALCSLPGVQPQPQFGARSRAAHRHRGVVEIRRDDIISVRRDVDTWIDLWDAARLGVGAATSRVLETG